MTATNHAITGALVATLVKEPLLAISIALAMHFAMDALPHFGLNTQNIKDILERNSQKLFKRVLVVDIIIASVLLIVIPVILAGSFEWWLVLASMIACMSPDLVWGYRFYYEIREQMERPQSQFSKFHNWIQWSETPRGIIVELIWFVSVLGLLLSRYWHLTNSPK